MSADSAPSRNWSRERIKFELRERGYTLAQLNRDHNRSHGYFSLVLIQPLAYGEKVIADILGLEPSQIWPDRYPNGKHIIGRFLPKNQDSAADGSGRILKEVS